MTSSASDIGPSPRIEQHKKDCEALTQINLRQEKRVRYFATKAQNLTIAYIISQTLLLFPVFNSSSKIGCKNWWVPFTLSLSASIIFFTTFLDTVNKYLGASYEYELNHIHREEIQRLIYAGGDLQSPDDHRRENFLKPDKVKIVKRKLGAYLVVLAILAFSFVVLAACRLLPCDDDRS